MSELKKGLPKYLAHLRKLHGISRDVASKRTSRRIKAQTIYMWESGQSVPDSVKLMEYLLTYGVVFIDLEQIIAWGVE